PVLELMMEAVCRYKGTINQVLGQDHGTLRCGGSAIRWVPRQRLLWQNDIASDTGRILDPDRARLAQPVSVSVELLTVGSSGPRAAVRRSAPRKTPRRPGAESPPSRQRRRRRRSAPARRMRTET